MLTTLFGLTLAVSAALVPIPIFTTRGKTIAHLGTVPVARRDEARKLTDKGAIQVGWIFEGVAIYGVPLFASDGEYCLYMDSTYWPLTREQAAALLDVPVSEVSPPITYWMPPGQLVIALLVAVGLLFARYGSRLHAALDRKLAEPQEPPRA